MAWRHCMTSRVGAATPGREAQNHAEDIVLGKLEPLNAHLRRHASSVTFKVQRIKATRKYEKYYSEEVGSFET